MSNVFSDTTRLVLVIEKIIHKAVVRLVIGKKAESDQTSDKYFIDKNGSIIINKENEDIQKSFTKNINGLQGKKGT